MPELNTIPRLRRSLAIGLLGCCLGAVEPPAPPVGLAALDDLDRLPLLMPETLVHYVGSIDKGGGNADWDWWLYQDPATSEWVLADIEGPGCLYNFVAHHATGKSDPIYRFYFDGEAKPRFEIKHSEFGTKAPFVAPLADWYGPHLRSLVDERIRTIDFRIVRSFVPMPFVRGCKVTSSIRMEGNEKPGGGWGHVMYHTYPTAAGVTTFTGRENVAPLLASSARLGRDPKPDEGNQAVRSRATVQGQQAVPLFSAKGEGVVRALLLQVRDWRPELANQLWLRCTWDGEAAPAIELPIGAFFGNAAGQRPLWTRAMGFVPGGTSYQYLAMPYWAGARIELLHRGPADAAPCTIEAEIRHRSGRGFAPGSAGHLRSSPWKGRVVGAVGEDVEVASVTGSGHVVAGLIGDLDGCEGDIRVQLDGRGTPSVEADGSESWACYGWGYYSPPEWNPFSAYDGKPTSMLRLTLGDRYPFRTSLRMSAENFIGVRNPNQATARSGWVLYYGEPTPAMVQSDFLDVGVAASEQAHAYRAEGGTERKLAARFTGCFDHVTVEDEGRHGFTASSFTVAIDPANRGLLLRRRSCQAEGRQRARVLVEGEEVAERAWIWPDNNPHQQWVEDEFQIPARLSAGKRSLAIRIVPEAVAGKTTWNEYRYTVFSLVPPKAGPAPRIAGKDTADLAPGTVAPFTQPLPSPDLGEGRFGRGLLCDGLGREAAGRIQLPIPEAADPAWTCSFWLRAPQQQRPATVLQRGQRKQAGAWSLVIDPGRQGKAFLVLGTDGAEQEVALEPRLDDNAWHFVAIRRLAGEAVVQVDGRDAGRLALAASPTQGPLDLGGAWSQQDGQQPFLGTLDEVHLQRGAAAATAVPGKPAAKDARTLVLGNGEP